MTSSRSTFTEIERRAVLAVADCLIAQAGRTTLVLALRGSRSKRVLQHGVETATGYGQFAHLSEDEVMACVDDLIRDGTLRIEYRDGFPLLVYTERGLAEAECYAAEGWYEALRGQVGAVCEGRELVLPAAMADIQRRNLHTVLRLVERLEREATREWVPLLRIWAGRETKRVRGRLNAILGVMEPRDSPNPSQGHA